MPRLPLFHRLALVTFWGAVVFTFVEAVIPAPQAIEIFPSDKAMHFLAFYVLAILAAAAYPRRSVVMMGAALSGFGALIEIVQAIPFLHRDCDFWDWATDTVAVGAALTPMVLVWWREKFRVT